MPRYLITKIQAKPEDRVQEFSGVDVSTYRARSAADPGGLEIATVEAESLEAVERLVDEIDRVQSAEPDETVHLHAPGVPGAVMVEDADEPVEALGVPGCYVEAAVARHVGLDRLYEAGHRGQGEIVAIVDSGPHMDTMRRAFGSRLKAARDFTGEGLEGPKGSHMTFCALYAAPPEAKVILCKGLKNSGTGYRSDLVEACDWAYSQGATHISGSFGSEGTSEAWKALCEKMRSRGVLFGASAGNNGCGSSDTVGSPGRYADVAWAAGDHRDGDPADFSSCGPTVDLIAPGYRVRTAVGDPEVDGKYWSGTSMSCPVGMQVLACVDSGKHGREATLKAALATARDTGAPAHREGHGWVDGPRALASLAPAPAPTPTPAKQQHRVIAGTFSVYENAKKREAAIEKAGFPAYVETRSV